MKTLIKAVTALKLTTLIATVSLTVQTAKATLIDFQGVAPASTQWAVGNNYTEDGFNLHNPGAPNDAAIIGQPAQNTTGSDYYTWNSPPQNNPVVLTALSGGTFSLFSLDVGSKGVGAFTFSMTGHLAGGGTVTHLVSGPGPFSSLVLNWGGLTSVDFAYVSGDFGAIDNLQVQVPDGGSSAMLLGMGTLGLFLLAGRKSVLA